MQNNLNIEIKNHFEFYEQKYNHIFKKTLEDLKKQYEDKDQEIFSSQWRKRQGYIPHGKRKRTIVTVFGNLTYTRHRYRYWDKDKYRFVYLSDLELGIEKYQRITNHLQFKILSLISEGKRYQDILDCFPNVNLHCRTISNIISRTDFNLLQDTMLLPKEKIKISECLYINIDDTFLTLKNANKKQKCCIRIIQCHTGYDLVKSSFTKKVLKNVRVFAYVMAEKDKGKIKKFISKLYDLANSFYSNIASSKIIISGDGAPWIRKCATYWPGSTYILDKFHAIRKINQVFNPKNESFKTLYQELKELFIQGKYHDLMHLLNQEQFINPVKNLKLIKLKNYLQFNEIKAKGITNQNNQNNLGCSIESAISHHIKWLLGYGAKAFSKKIYTKILNIHLAKVNGISIISLMKEQLIVKIRSQQLFFREQYWNNTF